MGEELELGQIYIKVSDGVYVPFDGFKPLDASDIWIGDEMDEETYNSLVHEGTVTFSIIQTHKQARQIAKQMNAITNCYRRRMRTLRRLKEKERRKRLKLR